MVPRGEFWSQTCFVWPTQYFLEGWISCQHKKKNNKHQLKKKKLPQEWILHTGMQIFSSLESAMDSHGALQQWTGQVLSRSPLYCLSNPDLSASHFLTVLLLLFLTMELGRKGNASSENEMFPVPILLQSKQENRIQTKRALCLKKNTNILPCWNEKDSCILICK